MPLVGAYACSHAGLMITRRGTGDADSEGRVFAAFQQMGAELQDLRPDAVIVFATDHQQLFRLDHVPMFTIGTSPIARGLGDAGIPAKDYPLPQEIAGTLLLGALDEGIDLAYSEDMGIDHSFVTPLLLALDEQVLPIVPIVQNCNVPPRPTLRRSHEVGRLLRKVVDERLQDARIAVIGTGGLSHWVGSPERQAFMRRPVGTRIGDMGRYPVELGDVGEINEEFDRDFLQVIGSGRVDSLIGEWTDERIEVAAGNGALELRNWLSAAGLAGDVVATTLAYEPIGTWMTGTAVVRFEL